MMVIVPVVLVVGVIAAIVVLGKGDGPPPAGPRLPDAPVAPAPQKPVAGPAVEPPKPFPPLDPKRIEEIRTEVKTFAPLVAKGEALYNEAMAAKNAGKDELWQSKLKEAAGPFNEVNDRWNEIVGTMPPSPHYDEETVANHYLGKEADIVRKATKTLAAIKKSRRGT